MKNIMITIIIIFEEWEGIMMIIIMLRITFITKIFIMSKIKTMSILRLLLLRHLIKMILVLSLEIPKKISRFML